MAVTAVNPTKIPLGEGVNLAAAVAVGADGAEIDYGGQDTKILLLIGTAEAVITKGDSIQAVADLTVPFETGKTKAVVLESGQFKRVTGAHKGKVFITGATATIQAVRLP